MIRFFRRRPSSALWFSDVPAPGVRLSAAIAAPFAFGILLGCVVGLFSESFPPAFLPLRFLAISPEAGGFAQTLLRSARYVLLALLCSGCVLGVLLLPALALLHGFFFSGAVAAMYAARHYAGLLDAALSIGLPALAGITAFLLTACMGLRFSLRLLSSLTAVPGRSVPDAAVHLRHLLPIPVLLLLETCYFQWFLPRWL